MELAYRTATFEKRKNGKIYDYVYNVTLCKYTPSTQYTFDFSELVSQLHDYVNAVDSTHYQEYDVKFKNYRYVHGLSYYDAISTFLINHCCDIRALHVLCDHKQAHLLRLDYLMENGYLSNDRYKKLKNACNDLYRKSLIIRNKYMKQILIQDNEYAQEELATIVLNLKEDDLSFCNQLLDCLENTSIVN